MTLMSFLFTFACTSSGSVALTETDDTGVNDTGVNDTGEDVPEANAAAGEYDGQLTWSIPEWDWTICDMKFSLEIDDGGEFAMDDTCVYIGQDGNKYDLEFSIEGTVDENGELDGEIEFQSWALDGYDYYIADFSDDLSGQVDNGEVRLEFFEIADMDYYEEQEILGYITLER